MPVADYHLQTFSSAILDEGSPLDVSVIESTIILKDATEDRAVTVFNVLIDDTEKHLSLVRYIADFVEFSQRIKAHYPRTKITLPPLYDRIENKRYGYGLRTFFTGLALIRRRKPNSEKVQQYILQCIQHPLIRHSSLLRDFLSVQREGDNVSRRFPDIIPPPTSQPIDIPLSISSPLSTARSSVLSSSISSSSSLAISESSDSIISAPETPLDNSLPDTTSTLPKTISDFQFIRVLGKGCMGKVLLSRSHRSHKLYALKAISKEWVITQREIEHTRTERDILTRIAHINHPFLIRLHHSFQSHHQLFLVLDYHVGGDLATQLAFWGRFTPDRCLLYTAEILLGLQELHRQGILYRDLKPENVLVGADGHLVLTDFGLSKQFKSDLSEMEHQRTRTFCGTPEYLAPEILQAQAYSYHVDFWSLGTILYEMLTGTTPFWAESRAEMYRRVMDDLLEFPPDLPPVTTDFIAGLLERDPAMRLGTGPGGDVLIRSHPYFDSLDWPDVYFKRIEPAYVPDLTSDTDVSHFDQDFVQMSPRLSMPLGDDILDAFPHAFQGYSYKESSLMSSSDNRPESMYGTDEYMPEYNHPGADPAKPDHHTYSSGPFMCRTPSYSLPSFYPPSIMSLDSVYHVDDISSIYD
ncbi:kinase-like domain-containing protein [Phycomyces blakesleeanus]|uniref:Kinase-like domain-containing protein n=2 Tax=Phycomyces blakesleeanus TaxID=4837 RepID=A0ABR3B2N8_PHYBL